MNSTTVFENSEGNKCADARQPNLPPRRSEEGLQLASQADASFAALGSIGRSGGPVCERQDERRRD
jgi:hypothetical protein